MIGDTKYAVEVVQSGSTLTVPISSFDGGTVIDWYTDKECTQIYNFSNSVNSDDLILYAKTILMTRADSGAVKGESKGLSFTSSADYTTFKDVVVDETTLTANTDYTVESGSTIITLSPLYLASLSVGTHQIAIYSIIDSKDVGVSASFTISEPAVTPSSSSSEEENSSSSTEPVAEAVAEPALDAVPKTGERNMSNAILFFILSVTFALTAVTVKRLHRQ